MKNENGYMTIEAAFIVPWTFFVIVWLIYVGYFEYDRGLLFQDNYTIATQTAAYISDSGGKQNWLNGHIKDQFGKKYMCGSDLEYSGNVSGGRITVSSSISVCGIRITDKVEADNFSFTKRLRTFRTAGRIWNGIKDYGD